MERKDDKSFKRDIFVLISFPILFVSTSFLVNIGKKCPFRGSVDNYTQAARYSFSMTNFFCRMVNHRIMPHKLYVCLFVRVDVVDVID